MSRIAFSVAGLLLATVVATHAAAQDSPPDSRYPVTVTPSEALVQKEKMRSALVALRLMLGALAEKDYATVEKHVPELGHGDFEPTAVPTPVYQGLEGKFRESMQEVVDAARSHDTDAVLRQLSKTMAWCQSCHAALRQEVVPPKPDGAPAGK